MAENPIQGFQTDTGVEQYDYNALANKPTLITQTEIDAAITAANNYTDDQISKIDTTPIVQIELDTTLTIEGKAADAKAVGDAISKLSGGNIELVLSDNLFDKSTAILGKAFYHSSSGTQLIDSSDRYYAYVELRGAGTYRTKVDVAIHSENYAKRVPLLRADKTWIRNITGTISDTGDRTAQDLEFVVTQDMIDEGAFYYPLTIHKNNIDTVMMVKDRDYPTVYIPYGYIEVETENDTNNLQINVLYGKTAVFLGDSLCAGTTVGDTAPEYGWGWAGLIGEANGMTWKNYGRNGGTITPIESVVAESRDLFSQMNIAKTEYSEADYVIFEGGANDAYQLDEAGLGVISDDFFTFDTSTFSGAMESLIQNILNGFPNAQVGYIVAQKMGNPPYTSANIQRKYFDRAVEICQKWGIPVIDLWNGSFLNPALTYHTENFYTDKQHLTLDGYKRISPQIESWMRNLNMPGIVPNSVLVSGGNVVYDEAQELTDEQKAQARENIGAQPKGNYLTEVPEGYAKTGDIPTDTHINSLIDAKLAQFTNVAEVGA